MKNEFECRTYGVRECCRVYARFDEYITLLMIIMAWRRPNRTCKAEVAPASLHHLGIFSTVA